MSLLSLLLLTFQAAVPAVNAASPAALPTTSGVYYRQREAGWISLRPAPVVEMKTKGMELFVETGGYSNLGMRITCRGAKAALRVSVPRPAFFIREVGSPKDAILVRLTQKKDRRVFQTSSLNATVENKGGFRKGDIKKMAVAVNPDNSFSVTPEENLPPGEYLLVFGYATAGYDFGIDLP